MKKRLLSLFLVLVMMLSIMPTSVLATTDDTGLYTAHFYGHGAQLNSFKLYSYEDGVKGQTDLLEGITDSDTSNTQLYETELAAGDYWLEGYDTEGACNGGIVITVQAQELNEFRTYRAYQIYASNRDDENQAWVRGVDYELSVEVTNQDKSVNRQASIGESNVYGTVYASCLCLHGDTVKVTYTPIGDRAGEYMEVFKSATMTANSMSWGQAIPVAVELTITAPENSTVSVGKFHTYYIYDFYDAVGEPFEAEGTVTYTFQVPNQTTNAINGPFFFYRVQNPDGVTYWDFFSPASVESNIVVTEEELFIGDEAFNSETVYHNFEHNAYDKADIYLNVNGQGYMDMEVGEKFEFNVFRNWMAIENFYNRKVSLPDMTYTVIDMEGNPSNLLTITPDANNSSVATMTANAEGTAIVLITYDAMYSTAAYVSGTPNQAGRFSAIWPENTGVVVVSVGADGTSIETNMTMDRNGTNSPVDAEHDILFYVGNEGASFTFTPEEGAVVTVNRSVVTDSMTFEGFTNQGVSVDESGAVTVSGLTTGRHIVKVEKDGLATYQILTAKGVTYELQDAQGNALAADAEIRAGDTIYIQFTGLVNPAEKMSGAYNFNARVYYVGEEGTAFSSNPGSGFGVYDFSANPVRQKVAITIPKYWSELDYTLNGAVVMGGFANVSIGGHRGIRYATGLNAGYNAPSVSGYLGRLPEITLKLAETDFLTGTLTFQDQNGNTVDNESVSVSMSDAEGNVITVAEDGSFKCLPGEYHYVINASGYLYTTGSVTVSDNGEMTFPVTLQSASVGGWDGITETEPAKDDNGVYQISNGAELAWFSRQVQNNNVDISGKLTADIDLAKYPWNNTLSSSARAIVLDGDGNEVFNLNATRGLFGAVGTNSVIRDLTVRGEVNGSGNIVGGIVGYACGTNILIDNCVNYASVSNTSNTTGGVVGAAYSYSGVTIRNCVNYGTVTGANYVGGIAASTGMAVITGSYNSGEITGTNYVGGIFGYTGYGAAISGCYNTGAVTGNNNVGGVGGYLYGNSSTSIATVNDCYNLGAVSATNVNAGGAIGYYNSSRASASRIYYLEGTYASDPVAQSLTEEQMKSAELDPTYFGGTCEGYPALLWQTDVDFHVDSQAEVTAPTCTEKGYTNYICENCEAEYRKDYVDALGHDWCEDQVGCDDCAYTSPACVETGSIVRNCRREGCDELHTDVIPATGHIEDETQTVTEMLYKDCVCSVCGESYRVWFDERLQYADLHGAGISSLTMTDTGDYPWIYNTEADRYESGNKGINSSASTSSIAITLEQSGTVSFDYGVSSESNYDKLTISAVIGEQTVTIANAISGAQEGAFEQELEAGSYTLTFSFSKDSSSASGSDLGWISNLNIQTEPHVFDEENTDEKYLKSAPGCLDEGEYYYSCVVCGAAGEETFTVDALGHEETETVVDPTCGAEGYTLHECERCGYSYRDAITDAIGHEYKSVVTKPTQEQGGYTTYTCIYCGDSYTDNYTEAMKPVSVYLSISSDAQYMIGEETGEVMALKEIQVPYFDLSLYGLEDFYFISEEYGSASGNVGDNTFGQAQPYEGKVTMLHLFLYATEIYYCGVDPEDAGKGYLYNEGILGTEVLEVGGSTGSMLISYIWGMDMNLNYYLNYEYPLASEGWGATQDQILLEDGDVVSVGHFTDWGFYGDSMSGFNHIESEASTAVQGEEITLRIYRDGADFSGNFTTAHTLRGEGVEVYYIDLDELTDGDVTSWNYLGSTDENGEVVLDTAELEIGDYLIGIPGQPGADYPDEICSAPGGIILTIEECTQHDYAEEIVVVTCTTDGYVIHTCQICGYGYRDEYVQAAGHTMTDVVTEATHDKMGYTTHTCSTCGYSYVDGYTDALEHTYVQSVTKEATCTEEGELTFTCTCGESYTQVIPVIEHTYTAEVTAPTCRKMGYTTYTCACGDTYKNDFVDPLEHDLEETVVQADCQNGGYTMIQCKHCDYSSVIEMYEPTDHTETLVNEKDATTDSEGYTGDTICAECGVLLAKGEVIPKIEEDPEVGCSCDAYTDVNTEAWYHEAVDYAISNQLMNGTGATTFEPNTDTTRAMLATLLYRIAGEPSVEGIENPFEDVAEGTWYFNAVVWAADNGVVMGTSETTFDPNIAITREQMVTMIWRFADQPEADEAELKEFTDADSVGAYAVNAMAWAIGSELVNGVGENSLAPKGTATRAQIATILMRYLQK